MQNLEEQRRKAEAEAKFFQERIDEAKTEMLTPVDLLCAALTTKGIVYYLHNDRTANDTETVTRIATIDNSPIEVSLCLRTGALYFDGQQKD